MARGRATRDRRRSGRAGRGGGADRARRPGALPPSAGALGGVPGGSGATNASRCIARWPKRRIPRRIRIAAHGIARTLQPGLDEAVADELERSADRARRRGGVAAAAAFLERAAELTPDPARRGARALAAAQAKLEAGSREAAETLLATAELAPLDELQRGLLQRLRAQIAFVFTRGSDGPPLLARCRQTARSTRSRVGARDISRGARSGHVRRTRRCRLRCPAGCRGGPSCPRRARAAAIDRPRSRRPGAPVHGGARRGRAAAQARAPGGQERGARWSRGDHALALAVSDRPVDDRVRAVGRRRVPRARHSRGATGPGHRRARPASRRARLPVGRAPVRRGVRRGRGACPGGGRDRARNRQREPHVRLAARRRLARRRSRSHGVHQRRPRRRECAKRGKGGGSGRLRVRRSQQRLGPLRGGHGRRQARQRRRRLRVLRRGAAGARRGGDSCRQAGGRCRRAAPAGGADARRGHGLGARRPGTLTGADERGGGRRRPLP